MWIEQYEKLMFADELKEENIKKAVKLKYQNMPDFFYKYRAFNSDTIDAFKNDILYFSSITMLNDPFECAMVLQDRKMKDFTYSKLINIIKPFLQPEVQLKPQDFCQDSFMSEEVLKKLDIVPSDLEEYKLLVDYTNKCTKLLSYETPKDLAQIADDTYRICSFSETMDNILMWSHYANSHTGFCIGYNFKEVNNDFTELMLPVRYSNNRFEISDSYFPKINELILMDALTRKFKSWEYEKEWRIWIGARTKEKVQPEKVPVPKNIYFGSRMSEADKKILIDIAKSKDIDVYQMHEDSNDVKLYSEIVDS